MLKTSVVISKHVRRRIVFLCCFLITLFLAGYLFERAKFVEKHKSKPLFEVNGPGKIIPASLLGDEEYLQYDLTIRQVKDSIFYFTPSIESKFYYPSSYSYIKSNDDHTVTRTSITIDRADTVAAVILPGQEGQFYFRIPQNGIDSDTIIFRFIYFDNSDCQTEKVAEAFLQKE